MTNEEENIKSRLNLIINNIDEFDYKFVTYKAKIIKALLQSTLQFIKAKERECEELKEQLSIAREWYANLRPHALELADTKLKLQKEVNKYKQALDEIIRFFKEDEKFARYSGRPVIFVKPALEKIEKILKENDIKIS